MAKFLNRSVPSHKLKLVDTIPVRRDNVVDHTSLASLYDEPATRKAERHPRPDAEGLEGSILNALRSQSS